MAQVLIAATAQTGLQAGAACPHDELAAALDAAVDELRTLYMQLRLGSKTAGDVAHEAREVALWLREATA